MHLRLLVITDNVANSQVQLKIEVHHNKQLVESVKLCVDNFTWLTVTPMRNSQSIT